MSGLRLEGIFIHPLKSARAVAVDRVRVEERGPAGDRRWMLTDADGRFLSQREEPRLARLRAASAAGPRDALELAADGLPRLTAQADPARSFAAVIWRDTVRVWGADPAADAAVSAWLGRPARVAMLAPDARRPVERAPTTNTSLSDGYPYLIAASASLADLNARLAAPLPMDRFRPNLVIGGGEPWAEDRWRRLRVGDVEFALLKPCARCVVTTTDQRTGVRRGPEPLAALAACRRDADGKVLFGVNAVALDRGGIAVGDPVEVLETSAA